MDLEVDGDKGNNAFIVHAILSGVHVLKPHTNIEVKMIRCIRINILLHFIVSNRMSPRLCLC